MKNQSNQTTAQPGTSCIAPALGAKVPDYIVDLLDDEKAEIVENHLLECDSCRATYMTIISIREAGRRRRLAAERTTHDVSTGSDTDAGVDNEPQSR